MSAFRHLTIISTFVTVARATTPAEPEVTVPPQVAVLLQQHCAGCHDGTQPLDLRAPLSLRQVGVWLDIQEALETARMPPPGAVDDQRLPLLGPGQRQELVSAIAGILSEVDRPAMPRSQLQLSPREWLFIVRDVAEPFVPASALQAVIASREELAMELQPLLVATDVCRALIDIDRARPADSRRLLKGIAQPSGTGRPESSVLQALIREAFLLVYRTEPTIPEVREGLARFRRFQAPHLSVQEATVALCTSYLLSPRLSRVELESGTKGREQ